MKQNESKKRNYVKRKRSLSESTKIILTTLQAINANSPHPLDNNELTHIAINHAKAIEATCWSRRAKFSDEIFQTIIRSKTAELCQTLLSSSYVGLQVLPKNSDLTMTGQNIQYSSQNRNGFLPTVQPKVNNLTQQHYLISSSTDSPSTSPSTYDSTSSSGNESSSSSNSNYSYPNVQNYPLLPSNYHVSQPPISINAMLQSNPIPNSQIQQQQIKQPFYLKQSNQDSKFNDSHFSNSLYSLNERSQQNPSISNRSNLLNLTNNNEENKNSLDCWNKSPHRIRFPSISSLLS